MRKPNLKVLYTTGYTIIEGMKGMYVDGGTMLLKPYTAPPGGIHGLSEPRPQLVGSGSASRIGAGI